MGLIQMRAFVAFLLLTFVASCGSLPRGAGIQSEVLAAPDTQVQPNGETVYGFSVFEINGDILPLLANWPSKDARRSSWINRQAQPASLLIAPGDMLDVTIWDAEENSLLTNAGQRVAQLRGIKVNSDGRIFIPFVGNLRVTGMSPQSARARIESQLTQTIPSAQVQVSVAPGRANTANLVSGVNAPGVYPLPDRDYTLLSLLSQGAGVRASLENPQVSLMRGSQVYNIALKRIYEDPQLDTTLMGGDRIIIEDDDRYFLSLGATGSEAVHKFPKDNVSALDALSIVGGVSDNRADPQGILILREYASSAVRSDISAGPPQIRIIFSIDLTSADGLFSAAKFAVAPGDLIYATESPVNAAQTVFSIFGSVLGISSRL